MNEHLDETVLILYADNPGTTPSRKAVESHLSRCEECQKKVDEFRALTAAQKAEETWWLVDELVDGKGRRAVREFAERCAREDAAAERLLRRALGSPFQFAYADITRRMRFRTGGVARLLCRRANIECDREPLFAFELAEAATLIAEALSDNYYPGGAVNQLRGDSWKEYATACRYLGHFTKGLDALDRAESRYRQCLSSELSLATTNLARAILLWKNERYDEALARVRAAAVAFTANGDTSRYFDAKQVEAVILHRKGDVLAACRTYETMLRTANAIGDAELKARAAQNLGMNYMERGDIDSAAAFLVQALQLYEGLDQPVRATRTRASIGVLAISAGNFADAESMLRDVETAMERYGMTSDLHIVRLHRAEALLMLGRVDEVSALCVSLVARFQDADMLTGALTAASFLKEAATTRTLTRRQLTVVRKYFAELELRPDLVFLPPEDD